MEVSLEDVLVGISPAASTSRTEKATGNMTLTVPKTAGPGKLEYAYSTVTQFNFNSLPDNAIVQDVVLSYSVSSTGGNMVATRLEVHKQGVSSWEKADYRVGSVTFGKRNWTYAQGVWEARFYGTNASSSQAGLMTFSNVKLKITYNY